MNSNEIISSGILELYVNGLTTDAETKEVLAWKEMYPDVAAEILSIEEALEAFAMANSITPNANVKNQLFDKLKNTTKEDSAKVIPIENNNVSTKTNWKWLAAASVALLIGSAIANVLIFKKYDAAKNDLVTTKNSLEQKLQEDNTLKDVAFSNYSQPINLNGTTTAPEAKAKIFWMKNSGDVYVEPSGLPDCPKGHQYQLWAIVNGAPVDAGVIIYNKKGEKYSVQKMKTFGKAEAFAITLEKEGGNPTPTMEKMYVMSKVI